MESLYFSQSEIGEALRKLLSNFKKDSVERKTSDYCKRKLDVLENYWSEFEVNHEKIMPFEQAKANHQYFVNSEYERTRELYLTVKHLISTAREEAVKRGVQQQNPPPTQQDTSDIIGLQTPRVESRGTTSKLDDMLHKQLVNFKAFLQTVDHIDVATMQNHWEFEDALETLKIRWNAIDQLHWEILGDSVENPAYEARYNKHAQTFQSIKKAINSKMWSTSHQEKSTPKMEVPVFTGKYHQWVSFKDLFTEIIHKNPSLSDAQKMQHLKNNVKGEAERLIQHLSISSDNYIICWEILKHRFDNKKRIFTSLSSLFLNLSVMNQQSYSGIKKLHDVTKESLLAIRNLGVDTSTWDPLLVQILSEKLDSVTNDEYIDSLRNPRELPVLQDFLDFLEMKFTKLESGRRRQEATPKPSSSLSSSRQQDRSSFYSNNKKPTTYYKPIDVKQSITKSLHVSSIKCPLCSGNHNLIYCVKFQEMPCNMKLKTVNNHQLCVNCIYNHNDNKCRSTKRCRKCCGFHHTCLHECFLQQRQNFTSGPTKQQLNINNTETHQRSSTSSLVSQQDVSEILLATALVRATAADNTQHVLRALVDQGSQVSLISERAAQQLGLKRQQFSGVVFGVGERENNCKGLLHIMCQSMYTSYKFSADFLIMNNLIKNLPNRSFNKPTWSHLDHINLADPEFNTSRPIDLLLGADVYALIMLDGIIKNSDSSSPLAQQSHLGWILSGGIKTFQCNVVLNNIADIQKFWDIEDINEQSDMSAEDQECVDFYKSTTTRLESGRYEVRIPLKQQACEKLGSSKEIALAQFRNLETKFRRQEQLASLYKQFMTEYEQLGHMKLATPSSKQIECFLPHHSVLRAESSTSKLRVVFNASARTSSGICLNDIMHKGPNLQKDLQGLLLKWRTYRYVYTADIEKMYRQIYINEADQKLQQIVWRTHPTQTLKSYQLTTITYGTKSAPFLAMMTLHQLASDEQHNFPNAAKIIRESFYMDDLADGAHSISQAKRNIAELNACLSSAGFVLRKWSANDTNLLKNINLSEQSKRQTTFVFKTENTSKTLGLRWDPNQDEFTFQYSQISNTMKVTKRQLLSEISKIFDPLGWLAPLTTKMKLLFQKVWLDSKIQWNDEVSEEVKNDWIKLTEDLNRINEIKIPRWLQNKLENVIELHGFCDASIKAYACVVYARIVTSNIPSVVLIAAKSRLVPISKSVSLPRLELCAAELLSKLIIKIISSLDTLSYKIYAWSDSKVTLSWIQGNPDRWKPFVANRVKKIISVITPDAWHYVPTKLNPSDSASRGLFTSQLINHSLWWQGPAWLLQTDWEPKQKPTNYFTQEELKININTVQQSVNNSIIAKLLNQHSSFIKITRIVAWLFRALALTKKRMPSYLTLQELRKAKLCIIKYVQYTEFMSDMECLARGKLSTNSKLLNLNPFLDETGIMRVGGRLKNANISFEMKYPIVIPYSGRLTELLIQQAHDLTFHGGARLTLSLLRQNYWIIKGQRATKKQLRNCVTCKKQEPRKLQQIMGNLPECRSSPAPPFYHTGVDFTGFIKVKANKGRGIKVCKGYIALFICMVTKAVHIEVVSDLSSGSFIAALRRMSARRGAPKHIYSDNGTNFIGANKILQQEQQQLQNIFNDTFYREIAEMSIEWHWNCPSWPSAGGIWERSIRSLKQHLKRVIGEQALTFEEYSTLLAQIEASLNSRPLCPISEDIDDIDFLTPAHFLTTRAGLTVIETAHDARTRWHLVNKIFQDTWKRWKTEYLSQLSVRSKWLKSRNNMEVGDLVTIHDDNSPAGKWPVGRVVEVHPGNDGIVRVVTLKTKNGYIKRPVIKLSILPVPKDKTCKQSEEKVKQTSDKESRKRTSNCITMSNLALTLLFFMSIVTCTRASYTITSIDSNQTLYFDPIRKMQLIHDEWKIVTYYNMSPFWQGDKAVTTFSNYLEKTCIKIKEQSHCQMIILQIQHEYNELQFYNQLLLNQHFGTQSRTRRGLINAVGSIANSLFGVLDQDFAEKYKQDIDLVRNNIGHLTQLYKNQTSVIEAEYNILKRTEGTIQVQHKIINKHLNELDRITNTLQKEIDVVSIQQDFTLAAMATINMLHNLKRIQDTFLDTISEIYHGQINLHLLTPKQLREQLLIVSTQISKELTLPVDDIHSNLYQVYKLLKIKARMSEEYFIFEITLPLVSRDMFQLYNLIPLPVQINRSMISVKLASKYVAINLRRDAYLQANTNDLQFCEVQNDNYLCRLHGPVRRLKSDEQFCEVEKQGSCKTSKSICKNKWTQLHDLSTYLYFCCDSYSVRIICGNEIQSRQVSKAGLIQLTEECIIKGDDITLYSYQQLRSTMQLKPDILKTQVPIKHLVTTLPILNLDYSTEIENQQFINDSLQQIGEQIKYMKDAANQQTGILTTHDVHQYVLSYGLLAAAAVAACLWFLRWRGRRDAGSSDHRCTENVPIRSVNDSARDQPRSVQGFSVSDSVNNFSKRWSSLRFKRDTSTSPITKRQSVFTIDDSIV